MGTNKKRISRLIELFENGAEWLHQDIIDFGHNFDSSVPDEIKGNGGDINWDEFLAQRCFCMKKTDVSGQNKVMVKINEIVARYLGYVEYYYFYKKIVTSKEFLKLPIGKAPSKLTQEEIVALEIFIVLKKKLTKENEDPKRGRRKNLHRDIFVKDLLLLYNKYFD